MSTVAEHQNAVRALVEPIEQTLCGDDLALGVDHAADRPDRYRDRVLVDDVLAPIDLPSFDNSQMDGYAVRAADLAAASTSAPVRLPVAMTIAAGDPAGTLVPGSAAAIMTGAAIPAGADAVVQIERVDPPRFLAADDRSQPGQVAFDAPVAVATFVRTAGSDIRAGDVLLRAGTRLGPAQLGVLASSGVRSVSVRRRMRVLLISTGAELRQPGSQLGSGQIYDANASVLTAALAQCGVDVRTLTLPDRPAEVIAALAESAASIDLVVTTGGVSAGAFEVVREALEPVGVRFGHVAMQPGGPQGLGLARLAATHERAERALPVVAFPGNPVSALVSFEMFLRPVLRSIAGLQPDRPRESLPLAARVESLAAKHQVRRGIVTDAGMVELIGGPSSHLLHSYAVSNVLVHLPVGLEHAEAGERVETWRIDG